MAKYLLPTIVSWVVTLCFAALYLNAKDLLNEANARDAEWSSLVDRQADTIDAQHDTIQQQDQTIKRQGDTIEDQREAVEDALNTLVDVQTFCSPTTPQDK